MDCGGEHFDAKCVEAVALVQVPDQRGQSAKGVAHALASGQVKLLQADGEDRLRHYSEVVEHGDAVVVGPLVGSHRHARQNGAARSALVGDPSGRKVCPWSLLECQCEQ